MSLDENHCRVDVMAREYLDQLTDLISRVDPKLPRGYSLGKTPIEVKHFFGGAAAYIDGHIFMSLTKVGPALKLAEADRERLIHSKQAKRLRYFPKAPIKKQYVLFPWSFRDDSVSAKMWVERSVAFTLSEAN